MEPARENFRPLDASGVLSWVHFGDLHLTTETEANYRDLLALIADANVHLTGPGGVGFAVLPGDNVDNGTEAQYRLLRKALDGLRLPLHAIPGDHDIQGGSLELFGRYVEPDLPRSFVAGGVRCVFLNSVGIGGTKGFGLRAPQQLFLAAQLQAAGEAGERVVVFMHTYPSELGEAAANVSALLRRYDHVRVVEMGHTHYNEVANDGRIVYAATRSTGQIEEGPVGFSVTCLDGDVVSWKFKALAQPWPLVLITSPADRAFQTEAAGPARGVVTVRARVWGQGDRVTRVSCRVDDGAPCLMSQPTGSAAWTCTIDSRAYPDGAHRLTVRAESAVGGPGEDTINMWFDQAGGDVPPVRAALDSDNAIGAYPSKGILGTQLGPNKNGHGWGPS